MTIGRILYVTAAGLILGGIVHLGSVLAIPAAASPNADDRLAAYAPRHQLTMLPRAEPGPGLPHRDPAVALGVCRFDLAAGPLRVRASSVDGFLSLAFYTPTGSVFYALTDRSAVRGALDILVVTQEQLDEIVAGDPEDEPVSELRLLAPQTAGFVTFRALAGEPDLYPEAEARIRAARCAPEPLSTGATR
ncbi:DUF1254 domain-containing protein [Alsobacter sp. SYSU M60028]|uniref:DUF1254 domain-containing protein n=1 Tax=Alsobacter ponti TaxID=2962936 RepID=A0ABT1L8G7_9HYPH|nr:DUF1254 domain-containing protein [Alsobacter ponti]MCP8937800.1 DUF1254 domain-containing protein [Alsobacter ponti]